MVKLPSLRYLRSQKNKWLACAGLHSLQQLLKLTPHKLKQLEANRKYTLFAIPKKDGSKRMIENPSDTLKELQRNINNCLQAVYYFIKHPASYGFCLRVKKEKHPHTLYTHALQHTGCHYLLNADLKDFFHTVSWQKVYEVFSRPPFIHNDAAVKWICDTCTHAGRLPMGAPTSPVISNLAATEMDKALEALAKRNNCRYTRYADDLSFSSVPPYPNTLKEEVLACIREQGFVPNLNKVKEYGKKDIKIVTGLQVGRTVSLGNEYWKKTDMLLTQLSSLLCLMQNRPSVTVHNQVEDIKEKINGFLAFAKMIGGAENNNIQQAESRLLNMEEELDMFESLAWDDIPYQF
jgi:RNA-directed DNA polymerase